MDDGCVLIGVRWDAGLVVVVVVVVCAGSGREVEPHLQLYYRVATPMDDLWIWDGLMLHFSFLFAAMPD